MTTKEIIKTKVDSIRDEYLQVVLRLIRALEPADTKRLSGPNQENRSQSDWIIFLEQNYGCLTPYPIERGPQGAFEVREEIE